MMLQRVWCLLVFSLTSFSSLSGVSAQVPSFVPGQVVMRYAAGTAQRATVTETARTSPLDLSLLRNVMEELGGRVHVPLSVTQLGSGDWLTLSVDRRQLSDTIEQLLVEENGVEGVVRQDGRDGSAARTLRFELTLTRSSTVYDAFRTGDTQALDPIVRTWSDHTHVALVPVVRSDPPTIEVDWQTLTLELIERLNALPEVEAAQPNYSQMRESTADNPDMPLLDVPRSD